MTIAEGKVGPQVAGAGSPVTFRAGAAAEMIVGDAHGRMYEATVRGGIYVGSNAVAGVAPGTALSTTPPLYLWNPPNSGKNLVVLKTSIGYVSGTLGAGFIAYGQVAAQTALPTGGTALTPQSTLIGGNASGVAKLGTGSTVANTPTILRPAGYSLGAFLATTAIIPPPLVEEVAGEFVIIPGGCFIMQEIGAGGTSPLVVFGLTWEEAPVAI